MTINRGHQVLRLLRRLAGIPLLGPIAAGIAAAYGRWRVRQMLSRARLRIEPENAGGVHPDSAQPPTRD
ncbi:hypothetical protein ACFVYT_40815 [Streptomyces sp. NPDC058290]|uniref:hypothetical protein n=1 Tax=Streptomyces sp. NPDC058290 TaxID=3346426 RepID=UPI0036EF5202